MLADHASHSLRVVVEGDDYYVAVIAAGFVEIGGDEIKDISFEEYLKDWSG